MAFDDLDALLAALYDAVSGPAGTPREWGRGPEMFHPTARLMRTGVDEQGRPWIKVMTPAEYIEDTAAFFAATDFYEREVARRVDRLGNIAHVRSVYEARRRPDDPEPWQRGVNSIQLFWDGDRWWVLSVVWGNERPGVVIPAEWLVDATIP